MSNQSKTPSEVTALFWAEGWGWHSWVEVEMYGVMNFHSGAAEYWGLYDKHTAKVVAVVSEDIKSLLGLAADSDEFWSVLTTQHLDLIIVS